MKLLYLFLKKNINKSKMSDYKDERTIITFIDHSNREFYITKNNSFELIENFDINNAFLPRIHIYSDGNFSLVDFENDLCVNNVDEGISYLYQGNYIGMWNVVKGVYSDYKIKLYHKNHKITFVEYDKEYYTSISSLSCFQPAYYEGLMEKRDPIIIRRLKDFIKEKKIKISPSHLCLCFITSLYIMETTSP